MKTSQAIWLTIFLADANFNVSQSDLLRLISPGARIIGMNDGETGHLPGLHMIFCVKIFSSAMSLRFHVMANFNWSNNWVSFLAPWPGTSDRNKHAVLLNATSLANEVVSYIHTYIHIYIYIDIYISIYISIYIYI